MILFAILAAALPLQNPSCTLGETEFLTYPFSDPDPVPCIGAKRYPYFRYDGSSAQGVLKKWQTVTLENGKIRVVLTPEIGGKIWGATDLKTGADFVYCNHVVKFRDVATRGPWTSGGIEYNFGIVGHAPSCSTPVDWFVRTNADASVSYFVSSAEYISRVRWQVEVRLRPGAEEFETHTTWFNASGLPQPYYHWMNAAYSVRGNPTFLFPGSQYIGHEGDLHPWPADEQGRLQDTFESNSFGGYRSFHVLPGNGGWFGIWWPKRGVGSYHRCNACEKYGRKIWLWPLSRAGGIWEDLLTDTDGQYTELQSGRCFQQPHGNSLYTPFDHPRFTPGATETFVEHWGVLRTATPSEMTAPPVEPGRPVAAPADFDWKSAYGLFLRGRHCFSDRGNSYAEAEGWYRKSLAKDPYFVPSLNALAALELRRGEYAACHRLCERVLAVDAYEEDANYLDGFAYFAERDDLRARDRLGVAAFGTKNRSAAFALVARTFLRSRENGKAAEFAAKALAANAANLDALLVSLVTLRGTSGAKAKAAAILADYPLFHAARYESEGLSFARWVRNELPCETYLELGSWYEESGLEDDAAKLFALAAKTDPVAAIRLAYVRKDASALADAARMPAAGAFPFRRESLPALRWAAAQPQAGWKGHYLLGVLLASFDLADRARPHFDAIDAADEPVAFLVRAAQRTDERRLADLRRAQALGDSWRVGSRICDYYASRYDNAGLLAAAKEYIAKYPRSNVIQMAYAKALQRNGLNRACLDFLKGVTFLPSELRDNVSGIWHDAQRALGEKLTWPENLGSGKPYPEADTAVTALEPRAVADGAGEVDFRVTGLIPGVTVNVRADQPGDWFRVKAAGALEPLEDSFYPTTSEATVRFRRRASSRGGATVHFRFSGGASAERTVELPLAPAAAIPAAEPLVFENRRFRLTVGGDAVVRSLVVKATGEEMVAKGSARPLMTAEQPRPFHNEVKLVHPNKRVVYTANRLARSGDELTVGFAGEPFAAVFRVKQTDDYLALAFLRWEFDRKRGYDNLHLDVPPVAKLRALQLELAPRAYFGQWLNVVWDDRNAAAVVSASPYPEVDHDGTVLFAELRKDLKMKNEPVALVVGNGREDFLDAMDALERDFDLPRGVESRRRKLINASIYAADDFKPSTIDDVIATARRAGMRLVKIRYGSIVRELASWGACGDYEWDTSVWKGGAADLRAATARMRAAGIVPGLHFLQTHIGLQSRYVTPVADSRLGKTMRFTLAGALPAGTNDIAELRVEERTCEVPTHAPLRILQFGGELLSYERASEEPPYRFFGVKRGAHATRPQAHPAGQVGGILDISEYGTPASCYVGENSSLQDEVADRIARLYNCGFGFAYMDGSEGVQPPAGVNVGRAQYRVWRKLGEKPLFAEGAAKSHFSWHMLSGANAYDGPVPERFKDFMMRWQVVQAPLVAQDMTRCDFGWWSLTLPGESLWWCPGGNDSSVGIQPDMWEFGEALSVAWSCPASCSGLGNWRKHPRGAELLEILRRWEDVRDRALLTPEQVAKYRAIRPGREVTLLVGADGKYVWRDTEPLTLRDEPEGRRIRAFLFEENGRGVVQFWCADKPARGFILPSDAPAFTWRADYAGEVRQPTRVPEGIRVTAANRGYLFFDAPPDAVRRLMARAGCEDPAKGVDLDAVRRRVAAREAELRADYAAKNRLYSDTALPAAERERARVAMLGILGDARQNWRELREYAKGAERDEIDARLAKILKTDMRLCGE